MKKIITLIGLCLFLVGGNIFLSKVYAQSNPIGSLQVQFCNNNQITNEADLVAQAGKNMPICVELTNQASTPITINIQFSDSVITADGSNLRACNPPDRPLVQFGNFLLPYVGDIILQPNQTIQKEYPIRYPIGFSGLSHGCLAYSVVGGDIQGEAMFAVRIRGIKYVDVMVSEGKGIQAIGINPQPIVQKKGDEYSIIVGVTNKGNVDETVHIITTLSNILGFSYNFTFDQVIPAETGMVFTSPSFILPVYGGPFILRTKVSYSPQFNFNITDGKANSQTYIGGTKTTRNMFFIRTRQSGVIILIIVIPIISSIVRHRRRK